MRRPAPEWVLRHGPESASSQGNREPRGENMQHASQIEAPAEERRTLDASTINVTSGRDEAARRLGFLAERVVKLTRWDSGSYQLRFRWGSCVTVATGQTLDDAIDEAMHISGLLR